MPDRPLIMGILNLNDDSFSDAGYPNLQEALRRVRDLVEAGVDILDIGAESARTNREPISEDEELRRLMPFLEELQRQFLDGIITPPQREEGTQAPLGVFPPLISVNTWRESVCREIAQSGTADILNDMSGLTSPANAEVCAQHGLALLIMHIEGQPKVAHAGIESRDITTTVRRFFEDRLRTAHAAGIARESLILDPGLGFAKTPQQDTRILRELPTLRELNYPLLLPIGRKGFIGHLLRRPHAPAAERDAGTLAVASHFAGSNGCGLILRVHNVQGITDALRILNLVA
jgi:dihydropteroate synthase